MRTSLKQPGHELAELRGRRVGVKIDLGPGDVGVHVDLVRSGETLSAGAEPVTEEETADEGEVDVGDDEVRRVPHSLDEYRVAVEEDVDAAPEDSPVSGEGLPPVVDVGRGGSVDALSVTRSLKSEERDADGGPADEGSDGGEV